MKRMLAFMIPGIIVGRTASALTNGPVDWFVFVVVVGIVFAVSAVSATYIEEKFFE